MSQMGSPPQLVLKNPDHSMRVWDISPQFLCRKHLLGEHRELHAIWNVITENKKGYSRHPETLRWIGKLNALYKRHEKIVKEMKNRGYNHNSLLNKNLATGVAIQNTFVNTPKEQINILISKNCNCNLIIDS